MHKVPRRLREPLHPTRTKCQESCAGNVKIRTAPQRERSDMHKVRRGLHERYQNSRRTTTRAIQHAQSAERVARATSKRTAPQREQPDMHKTTKRVARAHTHTHRLDFRETWRAPRKRRLPRFWALACRGLQSIVPAMKNEPEASEVLRLPHGISIPKSQMKTASQNSIFSTLSECRSSSPNTASATKNDLQKHLLCFFPCLPPVLATCRSATPAMRMEKCPMSCTCRAKRCFRLQNVPKVPPLPHEMDIAKKKRARRASKTRPSSCELVQSKCTWTSHKATFMRKFVIKKQGPRERALI